MGIEPTWDAAQRPALDLKCEKRYFSNPLILVWVPRNLAKNMRN
jgi:hypothetical protein